MENARSAMFIARSARMLHDVLERDGDPESYDLRIKIGEYVEWVIDKLFEVGELDYNGLTIVREFIDNDTVEQAAEAHDCSGVWWNKIFKDTCKQIDRGFEKVRL